MAAPKTPIGLPSPPKLGRELPVITDAEFLRRLEWEDVALQDPDLAVSEASGVHLSAVRIDGGDFGDARLAALTLDDCELARGNAANIHAERALLRRLRVQAVRLTGADLSGAELRDVYVEGCGADLVSLNRARLLDVAFVDCVLRDLDLRGAQLERVSFNRCDLTGADFEGARFKRCEMRECKLTRAQGVPSLAGVAMPYPDVIENAAVFAGALGILPAD